MEKSSAPAADLSTPALKWIFGAAEDYVKARFFLSFHNPKAMQVRKTRY